MTIEVAPWLTDSCWTTIPIRYVARLGTGHTPSRQHPEYWENCTVPWVTLADVKQLRDGRTQVITQTEEKISPLGIANSSAVRHPAGTLILSRTASVGYSAILGTEMATSQDFATWTCSEKIDPKFLLHSLRAMAPDLRRVAMGSTHKTVYMPDIAGLRVALPPLDEQRRIADFLDAETARLDQLHKARERQRTVLMQRSQVALAETIQAEAEEYGEITLRRATSRIEQGWSPQCDDQEAAPDEWAILKTSAVSSGTFNPLAHKKLPSTMDPDLRYVLKDGDLLLTRGSGSADLVGMAAVVETGGRKLLLSDLLYRVHLKPHWSTRFVGFALRSLQARQQISLMVRGASGLTAKIRSEDVLSIRVPATPSHRQREATRELERSASEYSRLVGAISRSNQLIAERRQALIIASVTGRFDVTTAQGVDVA